MPLNELDTEQRKAASAADSEVAVSAGAGSGKTRLLVARFLHLLQQEQLPVEAIAAITFTNKAANQMKARVAGEAARLAARDRAGRDFLETIAGNAWRANISTIHSFCSAILRRYPVASGIDPGFTIIEAAANAELRLETVRELLKKRLGEGEETTSFLLNVFGPERLKKILAQLLTIRPQALKFLDVSAQGNLTDELSLTRLYEQRLRSQLDEMIAALREFHSYRPDGDGLVLVYDQALEALEQAKTAFSEGNVNCDALAAAKNAINLRKGTARWTVEILPQVKAALSETREFIGMLERYIRGERGVVARAASLLMREFSVLESAFLDRKKDLGMLDQDDILIETWKLLRTRYDICREVSGLYRHILVDEFQDTDGLQMDIINMIAGNSATRLFVVGDPKQSIYRFRGADVSVFNRYIESPNTTFFTLATNYRSAPGITGFINRVFGIIMGEEPRADYDALYRPMKTHRKDAPAYPAVELTVFDSPAGTGHREEAGFIARRIREFAGLNSGGAKYAYGDMAILLRTSTSLSDYEQALLAAGIPFVNRIGGRLAGSPEAYDIGNLLAWALKPEDPALLAGVLMSPFFAVEADTLYELRSRAGNSGAMPEFLFRLGEDTSHIEASGELTRAAAILSRLHRDADRLATSELLERAIDETGYTLALCADPVRGRRSLAVVDLILETAARFEQEGGTRQDFAELLRSGASFTDETAQVETTGNTVSLMTIHGAKGLEFKVVFLADITGTGRTGGDGFLFDGELGPGFSIRDDRGGLTDTSILMQIRDLERKKELAESKRLFYVGCTRARDMLVITGCPPSKTCAVDADNWMSWLHNALGLPGDGSLAGQVTDLYRYDWISAPDEKDAEPSGVPGDEQAGMSGTAAPFEHTPGTVEQALRAPIPAVPLSAGPETISVSALLDFREDPELYFQRHVLGLETVADMEGEGYGREYGVAAHRVLERVDSHDPAHWGDMVRKAAGSLPAGLARKLESDIREFSATGLACAIAGSRSVEREQPFVHLTGDVLVRGTIDVLYTSESGAPVIVDYKTGKMPDDAGPVMERHRLQMAIYALAVWRATGRMPAEMVLAFLSSGTTRSFPCTESLLEETEALLRKTLDELSGHPLLTGKE